MQASLMMVTYNRLDLTKKTLNSIFKNTDYPFRLIIVDNGSTDGTVDFLNNLISDGATSPYVTNIHIQLNYENKGIAVGRNQCLKISDEHSDEWLSTIDNDIEVPFGWLKEAIEVLEANSNFGMIGVNLEGKEYPLVTRNNKTFQYKKEGNLGTACTVFNRKLHRLLGFFTTEAGTLYAHEDADFGMRARVLKYELGYIQQMGNHIGVGENDTGEYRKFKDEAFAKGLDKFRKDCALYFQGKKSYYIPLREK